jgi:hypothetical protein
MVLTGPLWLGRQLARRANPKRVFLVRRQQFPGFAVPHVLKELRQRHAAGQRQLVGVYAASAKEFLAQVAATADVSPLRERTGV